MHMRSEGLSLSEPHTQIAKSVAARNKRVLDDRNWNESTIARHVSKWHDRWLIYGKAGVAWANFSETDNSTVNLNLTGIGGPSISTPFFSGTGTGGNQDRDRVGWTVGTGIERAIWNNWSVKVEYDYLDFGTRTTQVNGTVLPALGGGLGVSVGEQDTTPRQSGQGGPELAHRSELLVRTT
jgi:opacity protein-like surface antigen